MAATSSNSQTILGRAIVEKCQNERFLDEDLSSRVAKEDVPAAYELIGKVKSEVETQLKALSKSVAPQVDTWIKHAGSLQKDIEVSKALGNKITQDFQRGDELGKNAQDVYVHSEFLNKEISYTDILLISMKRIQSIKADIAGSEQSIAQHNTMKAVKLLAEALRSIHSLPNYHRIRAYTLLENRALGVRSALLKDFDSIWDLLVHVDEQRKSLEIRNKIEGQPMNLQRTIAAMKNLGQVDAKVDLLQDSINRAIIQPRINSNIGARIFKLAIEQDTLRTSSTEAERSISALFEDLLMVMTFIAERLPDLSSHLAKAIMPGLCDQIRDTWLNAAIPTRIDDMAPLRSAVGKVLWFVAALKKIGWEWTESLEEWVTSCARLWVTKRRENDLRTVRDHLALGLSAKRLVRKSEEQEVPVPGDIKGHDGNDWDEAWSDDEKEAAHKDASADTAILEPGDDEDAWGAWGDDDPPDLDDHSEPTTNSPIQKSPKRNGAQTSKTITLKWEYRVSSMTDGAITVIKDAIYDALALTQPDQADNPIAPAAVVLFALPTLTLAMYRAVSPFHYGNAEGGNMFAYNDALWLGEEIDKIAQEWNARSDITPRANGKVKFENEITSLNKFGKRAYARELATQNTIIRDLLRGDQCFLSDDGVNDFEDDEAAIDNVVSHVRLISKTWEPILARTNWAQAIGTLLSTIAQKIIMDILDLDGLASEATSNIALLISKVVALEDLFVTKSSSTTQELPLTAVEYAPQWFKFQYLSELLQSNLESVRYYWFEGDVSLFYTPDEVLDLVELSFADTPKKNELVRDIRNNPNPKARA